MFRFEPIQKEELTSELVPLAEKIWYENYEGIITTEQIEYMLSKMYDPNAVAEQLEKGYKWFWMMENEQKVGFVSFYPINDDVMFLSKLYLDSSCQGKGYGKKALQFVVNEAKTQHCKRVQLTVNKYNLKGNRAYQAFGFQKIKDQITDFGGGFVMDDYVYGYEVE